MFNSIEDCQKACEVGPNMEMQPPAPVAPEQIAEPNTSQSNNVFPGIKIEIPMIPGSNVETKSNGGNECPRGVLRVMCLVDPCQVAKCDAFPTAHCIPSYCGGWD